MVWMLIAGIATILGQPLPPDSFSLHRLKELVWLLMGKPTLLCTRRQ